MTWHSLSPAAQDTFLLTLAWRRWWWWWRCGGLLCPIWSAGSPISAPPKPGGREAVAIAATTSTKVTSLCGCVFYWCVPLFFSLFLFAPSCRTIFASNKSNTSQILPRFFLHTTDLKQQRAWRSRSHRCERLLPCQGARTRDFRRTVRGAEVETRSSSRRRESPLFRHTSPSP
jgi:hypothetical protein